jgi:selenoprotein W-related protein
MQKAFGTNVQLIESSGGVFEVECDEILVYSKKALGRFPEDGEVLNLIHKLDRGESLSAAGRT